MKQGTEEEIDRKLEGCCAVEEIKRFTAALFAAGHGTINIWQSWRQPV
jgi:hypothetical protein